MSYISISYYVLAAGAVLLYYLLPLWSRWVVLLAASGCFYYAAAGNKRTLLLFAFSVAVSYLFGLLIGRRTEGRNLRSGSARPKNAEDSEGGSPDSGKKSAKSDGYLLWCGILLSAAPLLMVRCAGLLGRNASVFGSRFSGLILPLSEWAMPAT